MRHSIRIRHFSYRTEQAYAHWVRAFIRYYGLRHPNEMGEPEITAFLTHLAVDRKNAAKQVSRLVSISWRLTHWDASSAHLIRA